MSDFLGPTKAVVHYPEPKMWAKIEPSYEIWQKTVWEKARDVLIKHGPMNEHGIAYFLRHDHGLNVPELDLMRALTDTEEFLMWYEMREQNVGYELSKKDHCIRLLDHELDPVQHPSHKNYVDAYYDLYLFMEAAKKDPALLNIPSSYLDAFKD
jgi:hypothetical protein